jgi:hypothetical protein
MEEAVMVEVEVEVMVQLVHLYKDTNVIKTG